MRTHDKRHARTHLHPRHRKQHLAPVDQPRRWVTRSALTGFSQLPPPPTVEAPTPVLGGVGGMLPARMSVNVVDEHHALHARKKVDPLPNSVIRAWIHVLPPGGCCDLNVAERFRCSAPLRHHRQHDHAAGFLRDDATFARRCAVETTRSANLHLFPIEHPPVSVFLWRTIRYWAEY